MKNIFKLLAAATLSFSVNGHAQTVISLTIADGNNEGFNDPAPVTPVGGNSGTSLGQQRLIVFERAAEIWGSLINSDVEIVINAEFSPQTCGMDGTTLGAAGPTTVVGNFPNAPRLERLYTIALGNSLAGTDLNDETPEINTIFNSDIDNGCSGADGWYYGLDGTPPANQIELLPVVLHEIAHGLGFVSFTNPETGEFIIDTPDIWSDFLTDLDLGQPWSSLTQAQRLASAINDPNLVWDGPSVNNAFPDVLANPQQFTVNSPGAITGSVFPTTATFGPPVPQQGITGQMVLSNDSTGPDSTDGCQPLTNQAEINGNIALIRRGSCNFTVKAINAQNAGAIAVVIANNVADSIPTLGGTDPTVFIPTIGIEQDLGNAIEAQLPQPGVNVTIGFDQSLFAGTTDGFLRMHAPDPVAPGSSVSHWTPDASPNLLMEPAVTASLFDQVDLTLNLFEDIGWSVNFPDPPTPPPTVSNIQPEGVYINTFSGQISGQEAVLIRKLAGENNLYSIANFNGAGHIASISSNGQVSIDPLGVTGGFSSPNSAQFNVPGGQITTFNLQRAFMTDSSLLNFDGVPFPIEPIHLDSWTLTETTFDAITGEVIQGPSVFDSTLSRVSVTGNTERLRSGQSQNGQFIGFFQGTMASRRDFVIQIGNPSSNSDLALQTLPNNQMTLLVNSVGRGRFTDVNTFVHTALLENRSNIQQVIPQGRVIVQQVLTRNDPLLPGDLNGNGNIDNADRSNIASLYGLSERDQGYILLADVDNNGVIDLRDSAAADGISTTLLPINNGISGSWFNTGRSGEGWNIALLPGGQRAIIAFFTFAPDGSTQTWIVGTGDVINNEILFNDLNITGGTVFGSGFDPAEIIRTRWGDLRMYFTDCNNGGVSYSAADGFGRDARSIQRITNLAGVNCQQPNSSPPVTPAQAVTGTWLAPERDGEGFLLEALADNRVVLYWYTYDVSGGRQYWLGGVGTFNPATNSVTFDDLNSSTGTSFGDAFDTNDVVRVPWGSGTFVQSGCGTAVFSFNSTLPGFGSNNFNLVRLTTNNGITCNPGQFSQ